MTEIRFSVPGVPQGKGRPRIGRTRSGHAMAFTPEKTVAYEGLIALACQYAMRATGAQALAGPVQMSVDIRMPVPKSWSKKKREAALIGIVRATTKPDASNVLKAVEDACNGIAYTDDSQIVIVSAVKYYSTDSRVDVIITTAAGESA